jgi:hypothetical protein
MKPLLSIFLSVILFSMSVRNSLAVYDPSTVPNNKFGIHIFSEKDLDNAKALVNSNGGDWGYVTVVITEAERDHARWQQVFDQMRRLHLIPIVRLATKANGNSWDAPQEAEIDAWVNFLNSLNWVVQNRYVIINNEPNHSAEWGGRLDPEGYATYLVKFSAKLKVASTDFFVLPGALDPSSPNTPTSMSESRFLTKMLQAEPKVFDYVDGWTSHAYPNVSTSVYNQELSLIGKKLPVFVTETGWPSNKFSEAEIGKNLVNSYQNVWNDPKVVAVTPFILDYTSPPYDVFSWQKKDGSFYNYYSEVQKLPKISGSPIQLESGQLLAAIAQPVVFTGVDFVGAIVAKNTGQSIWTQGNTLIESESGNFSLKTFSLKDVEPTKIGIVLFRAAQSQNQGVYTNSLFLKGSKGQKISNSFSIEAAIIKLDKVQIQALFAKMLSGLHIWGP